MSTLKMPSAVQSYVDQTLANPSIVQARQILAYPTVSSFIAGGVAGAVSRTVVSPFERMKIIFQIQGPGSAAYEGVVPTLLKMWREEGWRGFMRGNGVNCIRIVPYSAVQFSSYTVMKKWVLDSKNVTSLNVGERLIAGSIAGVASVAVTYPLDIVRTRLSIQTASIPNLKEHYASLGQKPPGIVQVTKQIYRTEGGIFGLYRGIVPTTMGVAPYVGINFAVYEYVRELLITPGESDPSALGKLASGAIAGAVAQTLTYPFDVLRRRFQVVSVDSLGFKYNSVWHALSTIVKTEGFPGLYKGLSANLLKVVPSMAASWLSFEIVRDLLEL
ncbi:hypothetical protein D0Z00_003525 [Geotrichum galactomycetum]|uniref:Uncharacterized protein n=1 Tax=Geotrichum galactomycetum TaxID=27317 RepID=A0ACB6V106_9ASCO|nr:hypothetical protein D0Z00_003525 [Geotrichum candidum]